MLLHWSYIFLALTHRYIIKFLVLVMPIIVPADVLASGAGAHFANDFSISIQIQWKYCFAIIYIEMSLNLQKFAYHMACARFGSKVRTPDGITIKPYYHRFWITMKIISEIGPWCLVIWWCDGARPSAGKVLCVKLGGFSFFCNIYEF